MSQKLYQLNFCGVYKKYYHLFFCLNLQQKDHPIPNQGFFSADSKWKKKKNQELDRNLTVSTIVQCEENVMYNGYFFIKTLEVIAKNIDMFLKTYLSVLAKKKKKKIIVRGYHVKKKELL